MTHETEQQKVERLLAEARRLQGKTAAGQADAADAKKTGNVISDAKAVKEAAKNVNAVVRFGKHAGLAIYNIFKPVFDYAIFPAGRAYLKLWNAVCYKTDKETGEKTFRRGHAAALLLTTAGLASGMVPGPIGAPARGMVYEPIGDAITMALPGSFKSNETIYLTDAAELGGEANEYNARGCRQQDCADGGVYFRVRHSLAHNVWSMLDRGTPFYVSDMEVATIAPGMNRCEVTTYGYRTRIFQQMDLYPTLLTAKCTPLFTAAAGRNSEAPAAATPAPAAPAVAGLSR